MKILHVASEIEPFVKTGGLADVVGSLPRELKKLGNEVYLVLPFYKSLINKSLKIRKLKAKLKKIKTVDFKINLNNEDIIGKIHLTKFQGLNVFFVENDDLFNRGSLYTHIVKNEDKIEVVDYADNLKRFSFFAHSIFSIIQKFNIDFDIIHCHDWQTALVPILAKNNYKYLIKQKTTILFTIHNLAYQGIFPREQWEYTKLPWELFSMEDLEFWGDINLIKGAIKYADIVTTVSPTYAKEIQTKAYGFGLDGFLSQYSHKFQGILNGIDYDYWDPNKDAYIAPYNFNKDSINKKLYLKIDFAEKYFEQSTLPLLGVVSRLIEQKGIQFLIESMDEIMELPVNIMILGSGNKNFENALIKLREKFSNKLYFENGYNEPMAHKIYASSDFFLMPSVFEPCGLGQMIAMRYGAIPIVRATGGLKDSVIPAAEENGTGIVFKEASPQGLFNAIKEIFEMSDKRNVMNNCMKNDYSWHSSAKKYMELYERGKNL